MTEPPQPDVTALAGAAAVGDRAARARRLQRRRRRDVGHRPGAPRRRAPPSGAPASGGGPTPRATSDIPVGGGTIFPDEQVVVTQPTAGEFKASPPSAPTRAASSSSVADGTINCPCHGSEFSIEDGSVVDRPGHRSRWPRSAITVKGDEIILG